MWGNMWSVVFCVVGANLGKCLQQGVRGLLNKEEQPTHRRSRVRGLGASRECELTLPFLFSVHCVGQRLGCHHSTPLLHRLDLSICVHADQHR
jgi:hypothetical protein